MVRIVCLGLGLCAGAALVAGEDVVGEVNVATVLTAEENSVVKPGVFNLPNLGGFAPTSLTTDVPVLPTSGSGLGGLSPSATSSSTSSSLAAPRPNPPKQTPKPFGVPTLSMAPSATSFSYDLPSLTLASEPQPTTTSRSGRGWGGAGIFGFPSIFGPRPPRGGQPDSSDLPGPSGPVKALWQPKVTSPFQIILSGVLDMNEVKPSPSTRWNVSTPATALTPGNVEIFDIDLWENPTATVEKLHAMGKKVICYFSAGTSEDWRPDFKEFRTQDMGAKLPMWKGERWLDVRSRSVWKIMQKRILLASKRGCDSIDPDNVDGFDNERGGGFRRALTKRDAVTYVRKLSREAKKYGMSTGLKNAQGVLRSLEDDVHFAVNEECAQMEECDVYTSFLQPRGSKVAKPVFHIEYVNIRSSKGRITSGVSGNNGSEAPVEIFSPIWPNANTSQIRQKVCLGGSQVGDKMSTVIKQMNLDGWVMYCDGTTTTTRTDAGAPRPDRRIRRVGDYTAGKPSNSTSRGAEKSDNGAHAASNNTAHAAEPSDNIAHPAEPSDNIAHPAEPSDSNAHPAEQANSTADAAEPSSNVPQPLEPLDSIPISDWDDEPLPDVLASYRGDPDLEVFVQSSNELSALLEDDVWESDVGPIEEDDPKYVPRGAAKDRIGPNGMVVDVRNMRGRDRVLRRSRGAPYWN